MYFNMNVIWGTEVLHVRMSKTYKCLQMTLTCILLLSKNSELLQKYHISVYTLIQNRKSDDLRMSWNEMREDWEEICEGREGRVDTGVTIVSNLLDLRGDQLQGLRQILGK